MTGHGKVGVGGEEGATDSRLKKPAAKKMWAKKKVQMAKDSFSLGFS